MDKLKTIGKWLFANKKSLIGTIANAVATGGSTALIWTVEGLPQIFINGFDIAPIIYTIAVVVIGVFNELGICGKGFEKINDFFARIAVSTEAKKLAKAEKLAAAEEKAFAEKAMKELAAEEKALAKQSRKQVKAEAKARKEAEEKARIEAKKAEILASRNNQ